MTEIKERDIFNKIKLHEEDLYIGMVFKNYKQMCKYFELDILSGGAKVNQIKTISKFLELEKSKYTYTIIGIHLYKENKYKIPINKFLISTELMVSAGIYKIQSPTELYIGSSIDLYKRFLRHVRDCSTTGNKVLSYENATFELLYLFDNKDIELLRLCEAELIDLYKEYGYNIVNEISGIKYKNSNLNFKKIMVDKQKYEDAIKILKDNNITIKK